MIDCKISGNWCGKAGWNNTRQNYILSSRFAGFLQTIFFRYNGMKDAILFQRPKCHWIAHLSTRKTLLYSLNQFCLWMTAKEVAVVKRWKHPKKAGNFARDSHTSVAFDLNAFFSHPWNDIICDSDWTYYFSHVIKTALVPLIGYNSIAFESLRLSFSVMASQHVYKYCSGNHRLISAFELITFLHSSTFNFIPSSIIF